MTATQAEVVGRWRTRLRRDQPLPGTVPVSEALRLLGCDDRPAASCSDAIATAICYLLDKPPAGLDVLRYAVRTAKAQKKAGQGRGAGQNVAVHQPVSFYLPAPLADRYDEFNAMARREYTELLQQLQQQVHLVHPERPQGARLRRQWVCRELGARGLPTEGVRHIPRGTVARMAIDRAGRRPVDQFLVAAVKYAAAIHQKPQRARRDMHELGDNHMDVDQQS